MYPTFTKTHMETSYLVFHWEMIKYGSDQSYADQKNTFIDFQYFSLI